MAWTVASILGWLLGTLVGYVAGIVVLPALLVALGSAFLFAGAVVVASIADRFEVPERLRSAVWQR